MGCEQAIYVTQEKAFGGARARIGHDCKGSFNFVLSRVLHASCSKLTAVKYNLVLSRVLYANS